MALLREAASLPADIAGWRTAWLDASTPLRVLVAGAGDVRHVLCTIARARRQHAPKGAAGAAPDSHLRGYNTASR